MSGVPGGRTVPDECGRGSTAVHVPSLSPHQHPSLKPLQQYVRGVLGGWATRAGWTVPVAMESDFSRDVPGLPRPHTLVPPVRALPSSLPALLDILFLSPTSPPGSGVGWETDIGLPPWLRRPRSGPLPVGVGGGAPVLDARVAVRGPGSPCECECDLTAFIPDRSNPRMNSLTFPSSPPTPGRVCCGNDPGPGAGGPARPVTVLPQHEGLRPPKPVGRVRGDLAVGVPRLESESGPAGTVRFPGERTPPLSRGGPSDTRTDSGPRTSGPTTQRDPCVAQ